MRQVLFHSTAIQRGLAGAGNGDGEEKRNGNDHAAAAEPFNNASICYLCDAMTRGMNGHTNQIDMVNKYTLLF